MLTQVLWWGGNALETLLLVRGVRSKLLTRYPLFYLYLGADLLRSLLSFFIYVAQPGDYMLFYWITALFSVLLDYAVMWEIYANALVDYPGLARLTGWLLPAALVLVFVKIIASALSGFFGSSLPKTAAVLERDMEAVQAVLLLVLLFLLEYYAIPLGRNLRGLLVGLGLATGISTVNLTLAFHFGRTYEPWLTYLHPGGYCAAVTIWCVTLWSYHPNPRSETRRGSGRDYQALARQTGEAVARARTYLLGGVRS